MKTCVFLTVDENKDKKYILKANIQKKNNMMTERGYVVLSTTKWLNRTSKYQNLVIDLVLVLYFKIAFDSQTVIHLVHSLNYCAFIRSHKQRNMEEVKVHQL